MTVQKKVNHIIRWIRAESKDGFPNAHQNTMIFEIYPIPDSYWRTLFENNWGMERCKYVPVDYQALDFNFDTNNFSKLIVTFPSTLDKRRIVQEMENLKNDADRDTEINQADANQT